MSAAAPSHHVRRAALGEILALRHVVLRPGLPLEAARFAGDDDPRTLHVGAFTPEPQANVGCASFMASVGEGVAPGASAGAVWQLRGMATRADLRGRGIGAAMLRFAQAELSRAAGDGAVVLWCNARVEAVEFYRKHGWAIISERFIIEGVGPHHRMRKALR